MFRRLLLLASLLSVVSSWCTPFIACNQTIYGDFCDIEKHLKVILLGRPFQKNDELLVTGEFYNNGSELMDDAKFMVGLSKGLIMHQLGDDLENYLLTASLAADETPLNVTGAIKNKSKFGMKQLSRPQNITCEEPFTFRVRSMDGFGFVFGDADSYSSKVPYQYVKNLQAQSVFVDGQFKTSKIELRCRD